MCQGTSDRSQSKCLLNSHTHTHTHTHTHKDAQTKPLTLIIYKINVSFSIYFSVALYVPQLANMSTYIFVNPHSCHPAFVSTYMGLNLLDSAGVSTCAGFNQLTFDLIGENMSSYSVKKTLLKRYSTFFSFFFSLKPAPNAYH